MRSKKTVMVTDNTSRNLYGIKYGMSYNINTRFYEIRLKEESEKCW